MQQTSRNPTPETRRRMRLTVALATCAFLATMIAAVAHDGVAHAQPSDDDWLGWVNLRRAQAGIAPIPEDPNLSYGDWLHARYIAVTGQGGHSEDPSNPWYTAEGDAAARKSNVAGFSPGASNRRIIDGWTSGPFHQVGVLDPRLTATGFGAYVNGSRGGAALDVLSSYDWNRAPTAPVVWPSRGSVISATTLTSGEYPDPLSSCGFSGPAGQSLLVQFPQPAAVQAIGLWRDDGTSLPLCWYDGSNYWNPDPAAQNTGRAVLSPRNAVVVIPRYPLEIGRSYSFIVNAGGQFASSQFAVAGYDEAPVQPVGSLDQVTSPIQGRIHVGGWAYDLDQPTTSIDTHVYLDGALVRVVRAGETRGDVAAAFPGAGSAHGFSTDIDVDGGVHQVCVYAMNVGLGSVNILLGCQTIGVRWATPTGSLDVVALGGPGRIRVAGWALDPDTTSPIPVHLYANGSLVAITASMTRPDVAAAYPGYGPSHGFDVALQVGSGPVTLCAYAINVMLGVTNPHLGCRNIDTATPFGSFDLASRTGNGIRLGAWAVDPDTTAPTQIAVYVDGIGLGWIPASSNRPDVSQAFSAYGALHGLDIVISTSLAPHTVCLYAINSAGAGVHVLLGCRAV